MHCWCPGLNYPGAVVWTGCSMHLAPGAPHTITDADVERVTTPYPEGATHWNTRSNGPGRRDEPKGRSAASARLWPPATSP